MANKVILFLLTILAQSFSQEIRTLQLHKIGDTNYQCSDPCCSPSTNLSVANLEHCQIACLFASNCRTVTFDQSNNNCQLFSDTSSEYGNISLQAGIETMVAVNEASTGKLDLHICF